jgi:flagellar hook-basal body complex protein FliE
MSLSNISGVAAHAFQQAAELKPEAGFGAEGKESFAAFLDRHVNEVNDLLKVADQKNTELAVGKTENLHDAMIAVEKAETSFKLMVQLRNKAMEAYNEIIRMQV